jgi:hypothetical protein
MSVHGNEPDFNARPKPHCYTRASTKAAPQPRVDIYSSAIVLTLTIITGVAVFVLTYRGWVF